MRRAILALLAGLFFPSGLIGETLPHLRLDLPTTVEDLQARYSAARDHITPERDALDHARAQQQATAKSALHPRADDWFHQDRAAAQSLRQACAKQDQKACTALAHLYLDDTKTMPDEPAAYALSVMACEAGHDAGCELFVDRQWNYFLTENATFFPATQHFYTTCADGNASHCLRLGQIWSGHHSHYNVPQDSEKGQAFFKLACDMDLQEACERIRKPALSPAERFANHAAGCARKEVRPCYWQGRAHLMGQGTQKDIPAALVLLDQACRMGLGCAFVADLFTKDGDVPHNAARAIEYRTLACENGDRRSCDTLADAYLLGNTVQKDANQAKHFRDMSCALKPCLEDDFSKVIADLQSADGLDHIPAANRDTAPNLIAQCATGDARACQDLGDLLQRAKSSHAYAVLRHACEKANAQACLQAARQIRGAQGQIHYGQACEMGLLEGCTWIALIDMTLLPEDRLASLERLCRDGEGMACNELGHANLGRGYTHISIPKNPKEARSLYSRACDLGYLEGCTSLARDFDPEYGTSDDHPRMMALLNETCAKGGASACDALGGEYLYSKNLPTDIDQAYVFYKRACQIRTATDTCKEAERTRLSIERRDLRNDIGGFEAALAPRLQDFRPYFRAPARRLRAACAAKDETQCLALAALYQTYVAHLHEADDEDQARAVYLTLCNANNPEACFRYAESYRNRGHQSRHDISLAYFDRACDLGHAEACTGAGFLYELGDDAVGPSNDDIAGTYYQRACAYGNARGCDRLSGLFDVSDKTKSAFDLIACLSGDGQACGFIADDYRKGRHGVPKDKAIARRLYTYACTFGETHACTD